MSTTTPVDYLRQQQRRILEPGLLLEMEPLREAVVSSGVGGLTTPDAFTEFQFDLDIYVGVATPSSKEVPHHHREQTEIHAIVQGKAELTAKHRWDDHGWHTLVARAGDLLIVRPRVCHWFQFQTATGLAYVFKAPQRAGVGRFPSGKTTCKFCPHFGHGCVLPCNSMGETYEPTA